MKVDSGNPASSRNKTDAATRQLRHLVGTSQVGSRIPSERDLAAEWGVARMTARKAVEALVAEGLLERRRGSGSFVAEIPDAKMQGLSSFTMNMAHRGLTPSSRLLNFERRAASSTPAARLKLCVGDPVFRFTRLRLADDEPIAVETTWIPAELVVGLTEDDLSGSLFETLINNFHITPGQATSTIDSVGANPETAAALGLEANAPCLRLQMDYLDTRRRPLMAADCLYRGDKYQLHAVLTQRAMVARTRTA